MKFDNYRAHTLLTFGTLYCAISVMGPTYFYYPEYPDTWFTINLYEGVWQPLTGIPFFTGVYFLVWGVYRLYGGKAPERFGLALTLSGVIAADCASNILDKEMLLDSFKDSFDYRLRADIPDEAIAYGGKLIVILLLSCLSFIIFLVWFCQFTSHRWQNKKQRRMGNDFS